MTPLSTLSPRERQVLDLITEGLTDRQVAQRLGVSYNTARNHATRIYARLGVRSRTQAAVYAITGVAPPWEFVVVDSAENIG